MLIGRRVGALALAGALMFAVAAPSRVEAAKPDPVVKPALVKPADGPKKDSFWRMTVTPRGLGLAFRNLVIRPVTAPFKFVFKSKSIPAQFTRQMLAVGAGMWLFGPGGQAMLHSVGNALAPHAANLVLQVNGVTMKVIEQAGQLWVQHGDKILEFGKLAAIFSAGAGAGVIGSNWHKVKAFFGKLLGRTPKTDVKLLAEKDGRLSEIDLQPAGAGKGDGLDVKQVGAPERPVTPPEPLVLPVAKPLASDSRQAANDNARVRYASTRRMATKTGGEDHSASIGLGIKSASGRSLRAKYSVQALRSVGLVVVDGKVQRTAGFSLAAAKKAKDANGRPLFTRAALRVLEQLPQVSSLAQAAGGEAMGL